jgi:hypothetical protein
VATAAGVPKVGAGIAAAGAGTAMTTFDACDSDNNVIFSGSVTVTGGGGDIQVNNTNIADTQSLTITALTFTQPAS